MAFGRHPGAQLPMVTWRGAKSISRPRVPVFLVSRRNRTPANGLRPRSGPEMGMNALTVGPSVPASNSPWWSVPKAMDALATASSAWMSLPGTWRNRPSRVATAALPTFTRTPSPNASASWLLVETVSPHNSKHPGFASATRARPSVVLFGLDSDGIVVGVEPEQREPPDAAVGRE